MKQSCPCGSELDYSACCKRYIAGRLVAASPERLMRSRYTANVIKDGSYLFKTWHSTTRPDLADLKNFELEWLSLEIVDVSNDLDSKTGIVEFIATYRGQETISQLHETSHFIREKSKWFYLNGEIN